MKHNVETFLIIGIGGAAGAVLRYAVSVWAVERFGGGYPYGTLIINMAGSLGLALFIGWAAGHVTLDPRVRLLVAVGFFGAFTTFSTYATDSIGLMLDGDWTRAVVNVVGMNVVCLTCAAVGLAVGRSL